MTVAYTAASIILLVGVLLVLRRVILGPTVHDRILAVNVIGTKTIVLLALLGFLAGRPGFFLDIALAYALINFIATIAVLRYMERRHSVRQNARQSASQSASQSARQASTDPVV